MLDINSNILLSHGSGGLHTHELITQLFHLHLTNPVLEDLGDAAVVPSFDAPLVISTDSFVVNPIFFPGGDIGKLAVCGTVNDVSMAGGVPTYLSAAFILEEGLPIRILEEVVKSMASEAKNAGIAIIAGDTKVVEKGKGDQIFITTTGFGYLHRNALLGHRQIRPGDHILINGGVGEHGIAVLSKREGIAFSTPVLSDAYSLNRISSGLLDHFPNIRMFRDPTRGGLATVAHELATASGHDFYIYEPDVPIIAPVRGACELLGIDPLYLANEGKMIIITSPDDSQDIMNFIHSAFPEQNPTWIGEVKKGTGNAYLKTKFGGTRYLDLLPEEILPRIC